jgi:hypothetical protein
MLKSILLLALMFSYGATDEITLGPDDLIDVDFSTIDSPLIDIVWCGEDRNSDDNVLHKSIVGSRTQF